MRRITDTTELLRHDAEYSSPRIVWLFDRTWWQKFLAKIRKDKP